jgi:hypothetical protein
MRPRLLLVPALLLASAGCRPPGTTSGDGPRTDDAAGELPPDAERPDGTEPAEADDDASSDPADGTKEPTDDATEVPGDASGDAPADEHGSQGGTWSVVAGPGGIGAIVTGGERGGSGTGYPGTPGRAGAAGTVTIVP